jgi:hypothetical protein
MKAVRIFLFVNAAAWLPYGLFCLVQPGFLGDVTGMTLDSSTAATEVRAMYGGLQAAIGTLALLGALRPAFLKPALTMLVFLCSGLFLGRAYGVFTDGQISAYTGSAVAFELIASSVAIWLLARLDTTAA